MQWHEAWTKETWRHGRVLLIDYIAKDHTSHGRRKVVSQEFSDLDSLRRSYRNDHQKQASLRVIHVQNAEWARHFLSSKYGIEASNASIGALSGSQQHRYGEMILKAKLSPLQQDPWRGTKGISLGCDYLKQYERGTIFTPHARHMPTAALSHYDKEDQPAHGYDVLVQHLSVYVQSGSRNARPTHDPVAPDPWSQEEYREFQKLKEQYRNAQASVRGNDNGNTIIIFEGSASGSVNDTLIGARQMIESRWRRLTFYLPRADIEDDEALATVCMKLILKDIFKALALNWSRFQGVCETHVDILEEKIYRDPADESQATTLWKNSAQWMRFGRLLHLHANILRKLPALCQDLDLSNEVGSESEPWLESMPEEFEWLMEDWDRTIMQRTAALSELMFKSVAFRDARDSLQLGVSMWRLSWITFIFLPLTFTVGFFGMNVDTFESNPSIKWWFASAVAVLLFVVLLWYAVKHSLSSSRKVPLRRGIYEAMYYEFAARHPSLWTPQGPRYNASPKTWWDSFRWLLLTTWFGADKITPGPSYDPITETFGPWSDTKRWLARRWLPSISQNIPAAFIIPGVQQAPTAVASNLHEAQHVATSRLFPGEVSRHKAVHTSV